jgi:hypothetical protein
MLRISAFIAVLALMGTTATGVSSAQAESVVSNAKHFRWKNALRRARGDIARDFAKGKGLSPDSTAQRFGG